MPPPPSIISLQFTPVESDTRTKMVLCNHCQTTKVPRNSLVRKENHLRSCQAYQISATQLQQQQQQQQQQQHHQQQNTLQTPNGTNNDDTNAGDDNDETHLDVFNTGAASLPTNLTGATMTPGTNGIVNSVLPLSLLQNSIATRSQRSKPGNSRDSLTARYGDGIVRGGGGGGGDGSNSSIADDIYSGMPYTYPNSTPYTEPSNNSLRAIIGESSAGTTTTTTGNGGATAAGARKRGRADEDSPGLPNETGDRSPADGAGRRAVGAQQKRLRYAEFYLDEDDFEFVNCAVGAREERFREIVERLARLVRLRDTRGS